jgi:hypothetical protein
MSKFDLIDDEAVEAATRLFDAAPPEDAVYSDPTEVTVTLTVGQAYNIRALTRKGAADYLGNLQMAEAFDFAPDEAQAQHMNDALRQFVELDEAFATVAPVEIKEPEPEEEGGYAPFGLDAVG